MPDRGCELLAAQRLLNELNAGVETTLMHDGVARISRHEHDLQSRLALSRLVCQLTAVHARHDDVGQNQIDRLVLFEQPKSPVAVRCFEDVVTKPAEGLDDISAYILIVLDGQNTFARTAAARLAFHFFRRRIFPGEPPQVDFDGSALARLAVDLHVAAGLFDETVNLAEAEAGALAGLLGCEE